MLCDRLRGTRYLAVSVNCFGQLTQAFLQRNANHQAGLGGLDRFGILADQPLPVFQCSRQQLVDIRLLIGVQLRRWLNGINDFHCRIKLHLTESEQDDGDSGIKRILVKERLPGLTSRRKITLGKPFFGSGKLGINDDSLDVAPFRISGELVQERAPRGDGFREFLLRPIGLAQQIPGRRDLRRTGVLRSGN